MERSGYKAVVVLMCCGFAYGCQSEKNAAVETKRKKQPLVFSERSVQQARGMLAQSVRSGQEQKLDFDNNYRDDSASMQRDVQAAFLSRGIGSIEVNDRLRYDPSKDSCELFKGTFLGSGMLSSPSRMVTALHLVQWPTEETKIRVHFNKDGKYACDKDECNDYPFDETQDHFFNEEKDFLLRNRLTALSMEYWAREPDERMKLRNNWIFEPDDFENQPFSRVDGNDFAIRDIAILKAIDKSSSANADVDRIDWDALEGPMPTGTFAVNQPGIFYNSILFDDTYTSYNDVITSYQNGYDGILIDELWGESVDVSLLRPRYYLLHSNHWPKNNSPVKPIVSHNVAYLNDVVRTNNPLTSPDGTLGSTFAVADGAGKNNTDNIICKSGSKVGYDSIYRDGLLYTSADAGPGSSGGALIGPSMGGDGNLEQNYLQAFGPLSFRINDEEVNFHPSLTPELWNDPTASDVNLSFSWDTCGETEVCQPPVPGVSTSSFENKTTYYRVNTVAAFNNLEGGDPNKYIKWADRNYGSGTNLFDPAPYEDDLGLECEEQEDGQCISYAGVDDQAYDNSYCPDCGIPDEIIVDEDNYDEEIATGVWYKLLCNRAIGSEQAIVAGIVGSSTIESEQRQEQNFNLETHDRVGSFGIICSVPSVSSWTSNWEHLKVIGKRIPLGKDRLMREAVSFWGRFERFVHLIFESRGDVIENEKVYPRPVSMKMCPPNYYPNGFTVTRSKATPGSSSNTKKIYGISRLSCIRSPKNTINPELGRTHGAYPNGPQQVYVNLTYGDHTVGNNTYSEPLPTYFGQQVSLDQWIGNPVKASDHPLSSVEDEEVVCQNNNVIAGVWVKYDSNHKMDNIRIDCADSGEF